MNETQKPRPEDPVKRLAALKQLSSGLPFVIHLYSAYTGSNPTKGEVSWLDGEIAHYTDAGFGIELVARYRPENGATGDPVAGFSNYVRRLVDRYEGNPRFVSLQVTNEANMGGSGDASDGAYGSAIPALVRAVKAADEARAGDSTQLKIGFNWAYESSGKNRRRFWNQLAAAGGKDFAGAVDWVGLNSYPGTWAPLKRGVRPRERAGRTLVAHLRILRNRLMPRAGLGPGVPINVTENGWPTGPGRSKAAQARSLRSMVRSVARARERLNISDYRWFDLRDSLSSDPNFEGRYGLTDDLYRPKPAFYVLRNQIVKWSGLPIKLPGSLP